MPSSSLPNQFSRGIVDKTLYVRRNRRAMMADETMADVERPKTFEEYVAAEQASDPKTGKKGMWLLLGCIDYRYPRRTVDAMHRIGPTIPYDQFILAGASLGACVPAW